MPSRSNPSTPAVKATRSSSRRASVAIPPKVHLEVKPRRSSMKKKAEEKDSEDDFTPVKKTRTPKTPKSVTFSADTPKRKKTWVASPLARDDTPKRRKSAGHVSKLAQNGNGEETPKKKTKRRSRAEVEESTEEEDVPASPSSDLKMRFVADDEAEVMREVKGLSRKQKESLKEEEDSDDKDEALSVRAI